MVKKKELNNKIEKNKKILGILFIMFPAALLAMTTDIRPEVLGWIFRILLFLFQFIIVKNYLDEFYGE